MARKTKEESQRTRDRILDAAEHVFLSKGVASTTMSDIADFAGVSRGAVYGHYKNKIDVCIAMCDRALGEAVSLTRVSTDGEALESLYASMRQYVQIYAEEGSVQRVLEILYLKCERSDENAPLLRRRDLWERHALRTSEKLLRAAVSREDLPRALDVRLSSLPALPDRGRVRHYLLVRSPQGRYLAARRAHAPRRHRHPAAVAATADAAGRLTPWTRPTR